MARFHRYSLHNVCLIMAQRPTATRVAGFHAWRTLGRFVRKGEKGIAILAPIVSRRREETDDDESQNCRRLPCRIRVRRRADRRRAAAPAGRSRPAILATRTAALKRGNRGSTSIVIEYADDLGGRAWVSCGGRFAS